MIPSAKLGGSSNIMVPLSTGPCPTLRYHSMPSREPAIPTPSKRIIPMSVSWVYGVNLSSANVCPSSVLPSEDQDVDADFGQTDWSGETFCGSSISQ